MTALGFLLIVAAVWGSWAVKPTPQSILWLGRMLLLGSVLVVAGIARWLWTTMP